ncbi:MAG: amino acid ABC transporter ATP-binding protein [Lachnospiraceae bacterium]|nr:amino acid ABC transporter ATP-binding protein [Lachnospiraceae bacterium]
MIKVRNLRLDLDGKTLFDNVNFDVNKGEMLAILGESGSGKSSLLRCLGRFNLPTSGEIYIDGENIFDDSVNIDKIREKMGFVYQNFNLFSHLNVLDNIILAPIVVQGLPKEQAIKEAKIFLDRVGMLGQENKMPGELSGGQKQRVAIARALAMRPKVLLFDEPTSALDPAMSEEVESVITDLAEGGITGVIVTHELSLAKNIATKVAFMAEGGIYEEASKEDFFTRPQKMLTRRFLYRSRMFEKEVLKDALDIYTLVRELKTFLAKYETNKKQRRLIRIICDELLYPILKGNAPSTNAYVRLICSETSLDHTIIFSFKELIGDPLKPPYLDDLNISILEHYSRYIFSNKRDNIWEVVIQM